MTTTESNNFADKASGLFPKMTDAQMLSLAEKVERYPSYAADRALSVLAEKQEDFSLPKFLFLIRAELDKTHEQKPQKAQTYLQVLRQSCNAPNDMTDAEVMMRVGRGWWMKASVPLVHGMEDGERTSPWLQRIKKITEIVQKELTGAGIQPDLAHDCALAVMRPRDQYENALNEIRPLPSF